MDEFEQAHEELDRLQGIISRHEGHMFSLRGWLLTVAGALLVADHSGTIEIDDKLMRIALPLITFLFLFLEMRHLNLVEAIVERVGKIETDIVRARKTASQNQGASTPSASWYDGPLVSESCLKGVKRWFPCRGMTLVLNLPFYILFLMVSLGASFVLPQKQKAQPTATLPLAATTNTSALQTTLTNNLNRNP